MKKKNRSRYKELKMSFLSPLKFLLSFFWYVHACVWVLFYSVYCVHHFRFFFCLLCFSFHVIFISTPLCVIFFVKSSWFYILPKYYFGFALIFDMFNEKIFCVYKEKRVNSQKKKNQRTKVSIWQVWIIYPYYL